MIRETRSLFCKFSDDEVTTKKAKHYAVLRTIDEIKVNHRAELKPHKDTVKALVKAIDAGGEERDVECEWRDSLVNGGAQECVRLDTMEVIDKLDETTEIEDRAQPALPFAAPKVPELRWTGISADGETFPITAEQFDAAEREINLTGSATVYLDGERRQMLVKVIRARACEFCGAADGNHRQPECDDAKRDAAGEEASNAERFEGLVEEDEIGACSECGAEPGCNIDCPRCLRVAKRRAERDAAATTLDGSEDGANIVDATPSWKVGDEVRLKSGGPVMTIVRLEDDGASAVCNWPGCIANEVFPVAILEDSYDPNDTAQVAAKIAEVPPPNDRPLPSAADATVKVKPKRTSKKAEAADANGGE